MAPVGSTRVACTPLPHPIISPRLVLCVLVLYGLAQSCARDVVMTKQHEMAASLGITAPDVSHTLSYGYISYAIGKLVYGRVADVIGGRATWVFSFTGAALATAAFALCRPGRTDLTLCWVISRAFQPAAGMGTVRIASAWFSYTDLGWVLSWVAAMSYIFDAGVRLWISAMTLGGLSWRIISVVCGATVLLVAILGSALLRDHPRVVGHPSPAINPHSIDSSKSAVTLRGGLSLLLRSPDFLLVMLLGVTLGTTREIFLCFLEALLRNAGASSSVAIAVSGAFPLFGVPSVFLCGRLVDAYDRKHNGAIVFVAAVFLVGLSGALWALESGVAGRPPWWAVAVLSAAIGVVVIGPYSLLGGVFAADLGGRAACGLASGLIDCAGYLGAIAFTACKGKLRHDRDIIAVVFSVAVANLVFSGGMLWRDGRPHVKLRGETEPLLVNAVDSDAVAVGRHPLVD